MGYVDEMKDVKWLIDSCLGGRLTRIEYLARVLVALVLSLVVVMAIASAYVSATGANPKTVDGTMAWVIGVVFGFVFFTFDVRRLKDIMSSRPVEEVYFSVILLWVFTVAFPPFRFIKTFLLFLSPSGADESDYYKSYINSSIEGWTKFLVSFRKGKTDF